MHVTDSAYVAVLENKLQQAERSLYEFRKIFTHWTEEREETNERRPGDLLENGLYPGQYTNPTPTLDDDDGAGVTEPEQCVE